MKAIQQELNLFPATTFEDILAEENLHDLNISFNKRLHKSWHLTIKPDNQKYIVIPYLLKYAPKEIKKSIIAWTYLKKPRLKKNRPSYYQEKKLLEQSIWNFLEAQGITSRQKRVNNPQKFVNMTKGARYDLKEIFDHINEQFFDNKIISYVRWGNSASKTSYQSRCINKNSEPFNLITIAGVYNHPKVPEYAIKGVMFHEMLHIAIPPYKKNGRNIMHGIEFKRAERKFPYLKQWHDWESNELHRLLKSIKRQKRRYPQSSVPRRFQKI